MIPVSLATILTGNSAIFKAQFVVNGISYPATSPEYKAILLVAVDRLSGTTEEVDALREKAKTLKNRDSDYAKGVIHTAEMIDWAITLNLSDVIRLVSLD
jgi:hypothetical protein